MSTPDPEGFSLLAKALAALAAIATPFAWGFKILNGKADKKEVAAQFKKVEDELERSRDVQGKIFDQVRENEQRASDRHERLLELIANRKD